MIHSPQTASTESNRLRILIFLFFDTICRPVILQRRRISVQRRPGIYQGVKGWPVPRLRRLVSSFFTLADSVSNKLLSEPPHSQPRALARRVGRKNGGWLRDPLICLTFASDAKHKSAALITSENEFTAGRNLEVPAWRETTKRYPFIRLTMTTFSRRMLLMPGGSGLFKLRIKELVKLCLMRWLLRGFRNNSILEPGTEFSKG